MDLGQVLYRVSEDQAARRQDGPRLVVLAHLADAADDFAHPTLRADEARPPECVAVLGDSPAIACVRLLPGDRASSAQYLPKVYNTL